MLRTIAVSIFAASLMAGSAFAGILYEKPEIRSNECLATYDSVNTNLQVLTVSEFLKLRKPDVEKVNEYLYEIFRYDPIEKTIYFEFRDDGDYLLKGVEKSGFIRERISHTSEAGITVVREIELKARVFKIKTSFIANLNDGAPFITEGFEFIGSLECPKS